MSKIIELTNHNSVKYQGTVLPLYQINDKFYFLDAVAVDHLDRDEEAQPRPYDPAQAKKIAHSIRRKVLMQPLLTRYDQKKDRILITEGQHRWRAMKDELKENRIPCIVYVDLDRNLALLCGLEANAEDRARSLSGGDIARKTHALMKEYRTLLAREKDVTENEVTEMEVLKRMIVNVTRSAQKKFILGTIIQDLMVSHAKIGPYLSDRQTQDKPLTVRNFMFFLQHLVRIRAVQHSDWESMREQEFANVVKLTDMFAQILLEERWNPKEPETNEHKQAQNVCRRHPLEASSYVIARILKANGAPEMDPCFVASDEIDWDSVRRKMKEKLLDPVWNEDKIRYERSIEELLFQLDLHWRRKS